MNEPPHHSREDPSKIITVTVAGANDPRTTDHESGVVGYGWGVI